MSTYTITSTAWSTSRVVHTMSPQPNTEDVSVTIQVPSFATYWSNQNTGSYSNVNCTVTPSGQLSNTIATINKQRTY